jgi:hypothetical protein
MCRGTVCLQAITFSLLCLTFDSETVEMEAMLLSEMFTRLHVVTSGYIVVPIATVVMTSRLARVLR